MNAIFINPTARTITNVEVGDFKTYQTLLNGSLGCGGYIQSNGSVGNNRTCDYVYIVDDGLWDNSTDWVKIPGYGQEYFRGNMLIVGSDGKGGESNVKMKISDAKKFIKFRYHREVSASFSIDHFNIIDSHVA